jgi:hypothetical protein
MASTMAVALVCGILLLRFSLLDASLQNWCPVSLPLPVSSTGVSEVFRLTSGGEFFFQIRTTAKQYGANPNPMAAGLITVNITGQQGFRMDRQITGMRVASESSEIDTYTAPETLNLPRGDEYYVRVSFVRAPEVFSSGRGVVQLQRVAPSGYGLVYSIAALGAYACFAYVLGVLLTWAMRRRPER